MLDHLKPVVDPSVFDRLCTCGNEHPTVDVVWYSGSDAAEILAQDCGREFGRKKVLVLDDENTRQVAGHSLVKELSSGSIKVDHLTLDGDVEAIDYRGEEVLARVDGHGLIIAVGAGTINDLGKYAAGKAGLPQWTLPTAPSMNGYTSAIAAIKVAGVKRTLPFPPPSRIYADPGVIAQAPAKLSQAGFCDILAKSVSDIDWRIDSLLFSGAYCPLPSGLVDEVESAYLSNPEGIASGDESTLLGLFQGLLISGVAMAVAGSSAPASGGEHLLSHVLDMREAITGRVPELHGLQVGAGIILSAACYGRLAELEGPPKVDAQALFEESLAGIEPVWGERIGPEVEKRFRRKKDQLLALEKLLPERWAEIRDLCGQVRRPKFYLELMSGSGFEMSLKNLSLDQDEFLLAAGTARIIRERITVLDIAAQAGVLEEANQEALKLME